MQKIDIEIPVLVAGAGPVGLTTALELARRGIKTLVVERNAEPTQHPKMDVTNPRSMEHFRRLGVVERIRDHAVPRENRMDVTWVTRLGEYEVARFNYPNVHEARERIKARNDGSQPLEPNMRMSQVVLEPLLRDIVRETGMAEVRYNCKLVNFEQDNEGVTAKLEHRDGKTETVRCQYLAGCDGGNSLVRKALGGEWEGDFNAVRFFMTHFRTPDLEKMRRFGLAWHIRSPVGGPMISQDDEEVFTIHRVLSPDVDEESIDPVALIYDSLGMEIECEILIANSWNAHLVVADTYGTGRVWMAGDSVHQVIPNGGLGMNTGICDAADLGWKLAAAIQGWAGPALLQSIEAERRPVAIRNREHSKSLTKERSAIASACSPLIHEDSPEGETARQKLGRRIYDYGAGHGSLGIEIDFRYRNSPVICHDDEPEPEWRLKEYVPSTWPGVRAPHVFLEDGTAIFDLFDDWFTLLRFVDTDVSVLTQAAKSLNIPMKVVDIRDHNARWIYQRELVLIRPDQHVAWRTNKCPDIEDALTIMNTVIGVK